MAQDKVVWDEQCDKNFSEAFDSLDTSGSGYMTFADVKEKILAKIIRRMGHNPTETELAQYLEDMDTNKDKLISKAEFKEWAKTFIEALQDPEKALKMAVKVMFRKCDLNADGRISKDEFRTFMESNGRPMSDPEINQLFVVVDMDGDRNTLNEEELLKILLIGRMAKQHIKISQK